MSFNLPSSLFKNPKKNLLFSTSVSLENEKIPVSDPKAVRSFITLMDMEASLQGAATHFGGPFAFCELFCSLFAYLFHQAKKKNKQWFDLYHFINDAGHCENALYALKANYQLISLEDLKGFRSLNSVLTGHGESCLFPEGVLLSNGPLASAFSASQGFALADRLSGNKRVSIAAISDGACMEGEAKEALCSIPGMAQKKQLNPFLLIISDNNTKLSGRIDEESFSMKEYFSSLETLGWKVIKLEKAHDLNSCLKSFDLAFKELVKNPFKPVAIHAKTIKGFGIKQAENSPSGAHGFPLKNSDQLNDFLQEIYGTKKVPELFMKWSDSIKKKEALLADKKKKIKTIKKEKVQVGISEALIEQKKKNIPIISLSSDLSGSTGLSGFRKKFPESSFDFGVAESNMVSVASGLSQMGYLPIVDTFSQFGVTKGNLPLMMASLSNNPMICVFSHTGFQDAADGASHQCLNYFSLLGAIPNVEVYHPCTSKEAYELLKQATTKFSEARKKRKTPKTYVFFLGRETFPPSIYSKKYQLGKSQVIFESKKNKKISILSSGPLTHECLKACKNLEKQNIGSILINASVINQADTKTLENALKKTKSRLLTVEDHQLQFGLASSYCFSLKTKEVFFKLKSLGVKGHFGRSAYSSIDLYKKYKLDSSSIVKEAKKWLKKA